MPFTAAHPAILIPLRNISKSYVSWTALIIGSIVPDMEYFVWLNSGSYLSHRLIGIPFFDLPMTFIIAFIWHGFMRSILVRKWPFIKQEFISLQIQDFGGYLKNNWFVFLYSAILGILTHLLWDAFSHSKGFLAIHYFPILLKNITFLGIKTRPCYIIWYVSTFIGLYFNIRLVVDFKAIKFTGKVFKQNINFLVKIGLVALIISIIRISLGLQLNVIRHLIIIFIGGVLYALVLTCLFDYYQEKKKL